jgi:hypothetical protein
MCRKPWKSLIASPPRIWVRARSINSCPRSYTGWNPGRVIAADNPALSPVRSASSRNGAAPANPTRRSSSPTSSSPSAHEPPCTEEVHLPQSENDLRQSHSDWPGAPRPVYPAITPGVSSTPVKDGGRRRRTCVGGGHSAVPWATRASSFANQRQRARMCHGTSAAGTAAPLIVKDLPRRPRWPSRPREPAAGARMEGAPPRQSRSRPGPSRQEDTGDSGRCAIAGRASWSCVAVGTTGRPPPQTGQPGRLGSPRPRGVWVRPDVLGRRRTSR